MLLSVSVNGHRERPRSPVPLEWKDSDPVRPCMAPGVISSFLAGHWAVVRKVEEVMAASAPHGDDAGSDMQ